ncbi:MULTISPECIES: DUF3887 domain-containing protein [unclassified Synechococcus]|uniref:DUF3887 domain-containing protein n=1 Tax=unclassified Synechococcus TaxID=2626047 RepID=UPI000B985457|nr:MULTISPECIES: DUF3887 domain-containing protein [unclassified Synechococcus]MCP9828797.1 DUF3887 domain-containing protein [Synechococcus sp. L2F]
MVLRSALLAAALLAGFSGPAALATTSLSQADAKRAAENLLTAIGQRNSQAIYEQLAPELRQSTTVEKVNQRLQGQERILGSKVLEVVSGVDDSTVEAELTTPSGAKKIVLVVDERGRLLAWEWERSSTPIRQIASSFVTAVSRGEVVTARSMLSLELQQQISAQELTNRWQNLEKRTGPFQRVRGTLVASQGGDQQLVLVTTQFSRLTDNLFVILDSAGHIIGIDFPTTPPR